MGLCETQYGSVYYPPAPDASLAATLSALLAALASTHPPLSPLQPRGCRHRPRAASSFIGRLRRPLSAPLPPLIRVAA